MVTLSMMTQNSDFDDDSIASPDLSYDINDVVTPDDINLFYAQCCEIEVDLEKANTFEELHHSFDYELAEQHLYLAKQINVDIDEPENDIIIKYILVKHMDRYRYQRRTRRKKLPESNNKQIKIRL